MKPKTATKPARKPRKKPPISRAGIFTKILDLLNEAYEADPAALNALVTNRVPCGERLAAHPTIQVGEHEICRDLYSDQWYDVGMLGVINGFVEPLTGERVAVETTGSGLITRFVKYQKPDQ